MQVSQLLPVNYTPTPTPADAPTTFPAVWSPCSRWIALVDAVRVCVRDAVSLAVRGVLVCTDVIDEVSFTRDSRALLCVQRRRGVLQAWCTSTLQQLATIDTGAAALTRALLAPDSIHVLVFAEFNVRCTVWRFDRVEPLLHIDRPKRSFRAVDFSSDGKYLAIAQRVQFKDYIAVYLCSSWKLAKKFAVCSTDLEDLAWSRDSATICIWDTPLRYGVLVYSMSGKQLCHIEAYEDALGVKTVAWKPDISDLLAVGSYDQRVRLINCLTWKVLAELAHPNTIFQRSAVIYEEQPAREGALGQYVLAEPPYDVVVKEPPLEQANPATGIGICKWSSTGEYLATRNDCQPNAVWIWETSSLSLAAVLHHQTRVRALEWSFAGNTLALCTSNPALYTWTLQGAAVTQLPSGTTAKFSARSLSWSNSDHALLLMDKNHVCCCFPKKPADKRQ